MGNKLLAIIVLVMVASLSLAGCISSPKSNQAASSASTTTNATTSASASASVTPSNTPSPTVTPSADGYQVVISGPTVLQWGAGGLWTATVYKNGVALPQSDLTGKMNWFIDGNYHQTNTMTGEPINSAVMYSDANGESTTWSPYGAHTLNAEYIGVSSNPNASITVTSLGGPSATPIATPTSTPTVSTPSPQPTLTWDVAPRTIHQNDTFAYFSASFSDMKECLYPFWYVDGQAYPAKSTICDDPGGLTYNFSPSAFSIGTHTIECAFTGAGITTGQIQFEVVP